MGYGLGNDIRSSGIASAFHGKSNACSKKDSPKYGRKKDIHRLRHIQESCITCQFTQGRNPYGKKRGANECLDAVFESEDEYSHCNQGKVHQKADKTKVEAEKVVEDICNTAGASGGDFGWSIEKGYTYCSDRWANKKIEDIEGVMYDVDSVFIHGALS